jgi:hypothetical protein
MLFAQIYASDIVSGFDIHKPEKLNTLFSRYGDQGASYFQLLRSMGFEKEVSLTPTHTMKRTESTKYVS